MWVYCPNCKKIWLIASTIPYGRPCVRALNDMCREKRIKIDYDDYDFTKVW